MGSCGKTSLIFVLFCFLMSQTPVAGLPLHKTLESFAFNGDANIALNIENIPY